MEETTAPPKADARPAFKRKTVYIKKKFQRDFILKFCVAAVLAMIVASIAIYYLTAGTVTATYSHGRLTLQSTNDAIIWAIIGGNSAVLLALVGATIYVTLYVSHKIAGPLFRFEQDLKILAQGDLSKTFRLRDSDQLVDLVGSLNEVSTSLNEKVGQVKQQLDQLAELAQDPSGDPAAIKSQIEQLHNDMEQLFVIG